MMQLVLFFRCCFHGSLSFCDGHAMRLKRRLPETHRMCTLQGPLPRQCIAPQDLALFMMHFTSAMSGDISITTVSMVTLLLMLIVVKAAQLHTASGKCSCMA